MHWHQIKVYALSLALSETVTRLLSDTVNRYCSMFKVLEMTDFCIRLRTSLLFGPNNLWSTASSSHDQPPRTSIIMLCCSTVYHLYCCFSSHLNGQCFKVFSTSFRARLSFHGQLISSVRTCLNLWLIIRASTLLALTSW